MVGGIQANIKQPVKFLIENMKMGVNILNASRANKVQRFINLSSSCIYPRNSDIALTEEKLLTGELEPTNEGYALAKLTVTRLCEYINREDNSSFYKTVIPCNLYGKYDNFNPSSSHMVPGAIRKIHEAKENNSERLFSFSTIFHSATRLATALMYMCVYMLAPRVFCWLF